MAPTQATLDAADLKVQNKIKSRGDGGIVALAKNFRIVDVDRSGILELPEFTRAMELFDCGLTREEAEALFRRYDLDGSGTLSVTEYLRAIRGAISPTRKALVNRIFATMDADRSGVLTIEDIRLRYDASKHPDVLSGKRTQDEIMMEFLQTFEGQGGTKGDGQVTREEFMDYYTAISANIDSDDYFLLLLCNAWNFPYAPLSKVQGLIKMMQSKVRTLQKGSESAEKTLVKQFRAIDLDGSGEVEMPEFKHCMINLGLISQAAVQEDVIAVELLFILFDADASNALSYKEFAHAVMNYEF